MKSLVAEIIAERLGPVTADFPDASYKNEAAGILPTPVLSQFMTSYHYSVLRFLQEAGIAINGQVDNINNNQFWDAYKANTNKFILENKGISPIAPRLISGATRVDSSLPDFLRANGAALEFTILGDTTSLVMSTNNKEFLTDTDIVVVGVTAAPNSDNTADINDINIVADLYAGESDAVIPEIIIDNVGANVSSKVGQIVALRTPTGEIFKGLLKTSTLITDVFRGFYFDDSGDPIVRGILSDGDTITIMNIGWPFIASDGLTVDVSYLTPISSYDEPAPTAGQYWFNRSTKKWNKGNGASFDVVNVVLGGEVVSDATDTIASRSGDYLNNFNELNNIELEIDTTEIVKSKNISSTCSVYGTEVQTDLSKLTFDITSDLESPLVEAVDTLYYMYLSDQLQEIISTEKPYERFDLKGFYHPYHSHRCVGIFYNNSSADIDLVDEVKFNPNIISKEIIFTDEKTSGTDGGGFSSGSDVPRQLNASENPFNYGFSLLASNRVNLIDGVYKVIGSGPVYKVNRHRLKLVSDPAGTPVDEIIGENAFAGATDEGSNRSLIDGTLIVSGAMLTELVQRCQSSNNSNGFGLAMSFAGEVEVYSRLKFIKIR